MDSATDWENSVCKNNKGVLIRLSIACLTTAVGLMGAMGACAQNADPYPGGTKALGRVTGVYVKGGDNLFLALKQAPQHLRNSAERWVDVEFSDLRANHIASARSAPSRDQAAVQVGDVVEIQFAQRENPRYFPPKEVTRVTAVIALKDGTIARDFEGRILARTGPGVPAPFREMQARAHTTNSSIAPGTATGIGR